MDLRNTSPTPIHSSKRLLSAFQNYPLPILCQENHRKTIEKKNIEKPQEKTHLLHQLINLLVDFPRHSAQEVLPLALSARKTKTLAFSAQRGKKRPQQRLELPVYHLFSKFSTSLILFTTCFLPVLHGFLHLTVENFKRKKEAPLSDA